MNSIFQIVIFTFSTALFIIGIHQTMTLGFMHSYWIFMLSIALILWFKLRKKGKTE